MIPRLITALFFSVIVACTSSAHATLLKLYDMQGTIDTVYSNISEAELAYGDYNSLPLARIPRDDFNNLVRLGGPYIDILVAMFDRTYLPFINPDGTPDGEPSWMFLNNKFVWKLLYMGTFDQQNYDIHPNYLFESTLADLSDYEIKGLYIYSSFTEAGASTAYNFNLMAEVQQIPEPWTVAMFGAGLLALVGYCRKKKRNYLL